MGRKNIYLIKVGIYVVADEMPDMNSLIELLPNWARERNLKVVDCGDFGLNPLRSEDGISGSLVKVPEYKELQPNTQNLN